MKHKFGIKHRLIVFLLLFTALIIAGLWIFQTVFLDDFYRFNKESELAKSSRLLAVAVDASNDYSDTLLKMMNNNICVSIYDTSLKTVASEHSGGYCFIHSISSTSFIEELLSKTLDAGGTFSTYFSSNVPTKSNDTNRFGLGFKDSSEISASPTSFTAINDYGFQTEPTSASDSMLYCRVSNDASGNDVFIIVSTMLTPVDATVQTLRLQLIIISIILVIISLITSFIFAKNISDPIIRMTAQAKKLSSGEFCFDDCKKRKYSGYREIDELGHSLQDANDEINKVDSLRRELIANVSHDLRTPLTLISGYSEMMRDIPGEITPENLQTIIDETNRLSGLVSDMLSMSKIEAGMQTLDRKVICFTDLVETIQKRYKSLTDSKGFEITFEYTEKVNVSADSSKLSQVIINLLNNAVNYSGDEKKVIIRQVVNGDKVKLEIIDHGIGIPDDQLANIWDRYYRASGNHQRDTVGSGLGLSIVKKLLGMHAARYGVESTLGKGSCFWFELKTTTDEID